ncbi:MAG: hypothetical protein KDA24_01195 [Deltaproteobacteria bacterium]|nr:hypothetical protein [Deltaproteobacteria bacterium]
MELIILAAIVVALIFAPGPTLGPKFEERGLTTCHPDPSDQGHGPWVGETPSEPLPRR